MRCCHRKVHDGFNSYPSYVVREGEPPAALIVQFFAADSLKFLGYVLATLPARAGGVSVLGQDGGRRGSRSVSSAVFL